MSIEEDHKHDLDSAATLMNWCRQRLGSNEFRPYANSLTKLKSRINQGIFLFQAMNRPTSNFFCGNT